MLRVISPSPWSNPKTAAMGGRSFQPNASVPAMRPLTTISSAPTVAKKMTVMSLAMNSFPRFTGRTSR